MSSLESPNRMNLPRLDLDFIDSNPRCRKKSFLTRSGKQAPPLGHAVHVGQDETRLPPRRQEPRPPLPEID